MGNPEIKNPNNPFQHATELEAEVARLKEGRVAKQEEIDGVTMYYVEEVDTLRARITQLEKALQENDDEFLEMVESCIWNLEQCPSGEGGEGGGFCNDVTRVWDRLDEWRSKLNVRLAPQEEPTACRCVQGMQGCPVHDTRIEPLTGIVDPGPQPLPYIGRWREWGGRARTAPSSNPRRETDETILC